MLRISVPVALLRTAPGVPVPALLLSSLYGMRKNPMDGEYKLHNGIDVSLPQGTPVVALAPGVVRRVTPLSDPVNGGSVRIRHEGGYQTAYVHLSGVFVAEGQQVAGGQPIGLSGGEPGLPGSGRSTGPHLHLIVYRPTGDGSIEAVDPLDAVDWASMGVEVYLRTSKDPLQFERLR